MPEQKKFTIAHVTHEAVEQLGGIGTVLEGLMTSPVYQRHVARSILVGPTGAAHLSADPHHRLGPHGELLYSSIDHVDRLGLAIKFRPIEWAFNVNIVYGTRKYNSHDGRRGQAEVLLINISRIDPHRLAVFKHRLWEAFGLDSSRYEHAWDYEEYARLAEPAFYALLALLDPRELPCVMVSHEFMGMPAVLQAILEGHQQFVTVFHAHECGSVRRIIEEHPGHDTMFYNVLAQARRRNRFIDEVFTGLEHQFRHVLVSLAHLCDGIIAVGDHTRDELKFLNEPFSKRTVDLVYNGLPALKVNPASKLRSRRMLQKYSRTLLGYTPDILMTHVARPVVSKAMWRDLKVCHDLDSLFTEHGKTGALYILTSAGGTRQPHDVLHMEHIYGWPRHHRVGYPDLVGPEIGIWRDIENFNAHHEAIQVVLVNQFGWSSQALGRQLPPNMNFADLRRATDVEFGMAAYEPFGISPLEPLGAGAVCVITNVCGCQGFVQSVTRGRDVPNVLVADFTRLDRPMTIDQLKAMTQTDRDRIEHEVATELASQLWDRIPKNDRDRAQSIARGQAMLKEMGWDQVIQKGFVPLLDRIRRNPDGNGRKLRKKPG
jgi:hypothetical protein